MADSNEKEATLTEEHVIIIACVCGVIIVTLLIILFCFIFKRRKNAAKNYNQGGNQGDPPPYNSVPPKKPQAYDNQGMDTSDLQLTQIAAPALHPSAPSPPSSPVHANPNRFTNNSYGPLDLQQSTSGHGPHSPRSDQYMAEVGAHRRPVSPLARGGGPGSEKDLYENVKNHRIENNRMDGYQNRDAQGTGGVPRSPTKDKYIDLQDRGGGGDNLMGPDGGYNGSGDPAAGGGKPKKVIYEVVV